MASDASNPQQRVLLRCVTCENSLGPWHTEKSAYRCSACGAVFSVREGVLDFLGDTQVLGGAQMSSFARHWSNPASEMVIEARMAALSARLHGREPTRRIGMLLDVGGGYGDLAAVAAKRSGFVVCVNPSIEELHDASTFFWFVRSHRTCHSCRASFRL
jgi:hypothetical protein